MRAGGRSLNLTEWVVLALVAEGTTHGFDVARVLDDGGDLGRIWTVKRPLVYRALDSLTKSVMHEALLEIYYKNKVTIFFITHDLEEAIFLGHKLVIMTSRPCRPKKVLEVDIPHPRDYSVLTSRRFRELLEETSSVVHEEARKSFAAGEKEG